MTIIHITYAIKVDDRWFKEGTEYIYLGRFFHEDAWTYLVTIDEVDYYIPEEACALLEKESASTDTRSETEKLEDYVIRDPVPVLLGKNDVVLAAKEFLGQDIAAKKMMDQADYDQRALARLRSDTRTGTTYPGNAIGVNQRPEPEPEPPLDDNAFRDDDFDQNSFL